MPLFNTTKVSVRMNQNHSSTEPSMTELSLSVASQKCITDLDQEHLLTFTGVRSFPSIWATFVKSTAKNKRTECPRESEQNRLPGFQAMVSFLWVLRQGCWVGRFSSSPTRRANGAPRWLWLLLHHSYAAKTGSVACCGSEVFWKEENYRNEAENQPGSTLKTAAVQVLKETQQLSRLAVLLYDWDLKENTRTSSKWSPQFLVSTSSWRKHLAPSVKLLSTVIKHSWSNTVMVVGFICRTLCFEDVKIGWSLFHRLWSKKETSFQTLLFVCVDDRSSQ